MVSKRLPATTMLFPTPVVLVTCVDEKGKPNIITLAWAGVVNSDPPMIGISIRPSRYSHGCIKATKEFVINIPTESMVRDVDVCGLVSGREKDKFALMGWQPVPATEVKAPLIEECPVQLECLLKEVLSLGSHDLFLGQVVAVHVKEEVQKGRKGIDVKKCLPVAYCPGSHEYWSLGRLLGDFGFSRGKR